MRAKLGIGPVEDSFEQEADRVADAVTRGSGPAVVVPSGSAPAVQRCSCGKSSAGECEECKSQAKVVQRASAGSSFSGVPAPRSVHNALRSPGAPLDSGTRGFMERRFGHDFSRVRIHSDNEAAESARSIDALAYTAGHKIVFATGQYSPSTPAGRHLLAHELTHVVQQGNAQDSTLIRRSVKFKTRHFDPREDVIPKVLGGSAPVALTTPTINGTELPKNKNLTPADVEHARSIVRQALTPSANGFRSIPAASPAPPAGASPVPAPGGSPTPTPRTPTPRTPAPTTSPAPPHRSPPPPPTAGSGVPAPAPNAPAPSAPKHDAPSQAGSNAPPQQTPAPQAPAQQTPAPPTVCAFQDFDITISVNMMLPTEPANGMWTGTIAPSALPPGAVSAAAMPTCTGRSSIGIEMTGDPSTAEVYRWLLANEEDHVNDLHDAAVNNLTPYFNWLLALRGSGADDAACHADLTSKLNQPEANGKTKIENMAAAFIQDVIDHVATHDPTGRHSLKIVRAHGEPDCSKIHFTVKRKIP